MLFYHAFLFFLIINLCFLIPAVIAQIFNPTAELSMSTGVATNEVSAETEREPVIFEAKISVQHNLNTYMSFYAFHSLNHCVYLF